MPPSSEPARVAARADEAGAEPAGIAQRADEAGADQAQAETTATLPPDVDLHARPAAQFVRTALGYRARIVVAAGDREADAKSLLSVLALGAKAGTTLRLRAEGEDGPAAVAALAGCVVGLTE